MASQTVGIQEFQENLPTFVEGRQTLAITRHGETLGFFVPTRRPHERDAALERLRVAAEASDQMVAEWGKSEGELMAEVRDIRRAQREQPPPRD